MTLDGYADAAAQDEFWAGQACTVSVIYDQSPMGNDVTRAPASCFTGNDGSAAEDDCESDAAAKPPTVGGHDVYALYTNVHEGYRNNDAVGTAEGTESQGIYMVADGTHNGPACCFDFGTSARDLCYGPTGIMSALFFGTATWGNGSGNGPWMMADSSSAFGLAATSDTSAGWRTTSGTPCREPTSRKTLSGRPTLPCPSPTHSACSRTNTWRPKAEATTRSGWGTPRPAR